MNYRKQDFLISLREIILFLIFLTENINNLESQDPADLLLAKTSLDKLLLCDPPILILVHFSEGRLRQEFLRLKVGIFSLQESVHVLQYNGDQRWDCGSGSCYLYDLVHLYCCDNTVTIEVKHSENLTHHLLRSPIIHDVEH